MGKGDITVTRRLEEVYFHLFDIAVQGIGGDVLIEGKCRQLGVKKA